jgi:CubicO group peptidase (beta-lactamase class C family)
MFETKHSILPVMKNIFCRLTLLGARALITLLTVFSVASAATPVAVCATDAAAEMNRILATAFHPDAPGVAVLVVQNGTVKLRKGYGLADMELGVPVDPANVFPICSITKQFTAVAILQLVEAGKLKLTDDLSMFVPEYPTGEAKITLAQLLGHMSGLPSIEEQPEWRKTWREDLTPAQLLDFTRNKPLAFAPGTNWKYSNTAYFLLGRVIEKTSGQSYPDYVRTHLFSPAAMTHSYYPEGNRLIPQRVHGYSRAGKTWANAPYFSITQAYSAGALLATVDDLWAWEQALQAGHLVNSSLLEGAYSEGHLPDGRSTHYGLGWEVNKINRHNVIEHGGGMPGFATYASRVPDAGIYVAILSNTDAPAVPLRTLVANLIRVLLGETAPSSITLALPAAEMEDYVGSYRIGGPATFIVSAKDGVLSGQLGPGRKPLSLAAPDEFKTSNDEMHFTFVRDDARRIQKVLVRTDGPGPELIWPRVEEPAKTPNLSP